jgi:hypothetical protein
MIKKIYTDKLPRFVVFYYILNWIPKKIQFNYIYNIKSIIFIPILYIKIFFTFFARIIFHLPAWIQDIVLVSI